VTILFIYTKITELSYKRFQILNGPDAQPDENQQKYTFLHQLWLLKRKDRHPLRIDSSMPESCKNTGTRWSDENAPCLKNDGEV